MENTEGTDQDQAILPDYRHISVEQRDGGLVVRFIDLKRDLESFDAAFKEITQEFRGLADHNRTSSVVLDLEGQDVSDTEYLFVILVRLSREVTQANGTLKLCNLAPQVLDALKMTRLIKFFSTYESLDDALAGKAHDPS
jgi:anti-anti-sigma factor